MPDNRDFSDSAFGLIDEHFCSHKIPSRACERSGNDRIGQVSCCASKHFAECSL